MQFIVKVQYYSMTTGELSPREYSYYSIDRLAVGDIVTVLVRDTTTKAKVTAVDVPEAEIAAFKDKMKTIPAGSVLGEVEGEDVVVKEATVEEKVGVIIKVSSPPGAPAGEEEEVAGEIVKLVELIAEATGSPPH